MERRDHKLLQLPASVFENVCQYLKPTDVKNLSFASYGLLSAIENVQKWAPRLYLLNINSARQYKQNVRMIPEVYPGSYLIDCRELFEHKQQEIISLTCSPASPPTYNEAHLANWSRALHFQKRYSPDRWMSRVWLCPHVTCKFEDIKRVTQQQVPPVSVYDTTSMLCPFPKCSLWARHVVIATSTTPSTYEMCSTIRIYRRRCSSLDGIRRMLVSQVFYHHLIRATKELRLQICSHLLMSSSQVLIGYDFRNIVLLDASQRYANANVEASLQQALEQRCCQDCDLTGTYTTWGFLARYTQDSDAFWVDLEMILCRPLFGCDVQHGYKSVDWMSHTCSGFDTSVYNIMWDAWAKIVAEGGFDWRTPLPAAFLRQPSRGLLDFPSNTQKPFKREPGALASRSIPQRSMNYLRLAIHGK